MLHVQYLYGRLLVRTRATGVSTVGYKMYEKDCIEVAGRGRGEGLLRVATAPLGCSYLLRFTPTFLSPCPDMFPGNTCHTRL